MTFAIEVYTEALVPNFENSHIDPHKLSSRTQLQMCADITKISRPNTESQRKRSVRLQDPGSEQPDL
jgi:hypothetical protein